MDRYTPEALPPAPAACASSTLTRLIPGTRTLARTGPPTLPAPAGDASPAAPGCDARPAAPGCDGRSAALGGDAGLAAPGGDARPVAAAGSAGPVGPAGDVGAVPTGGAGSLLAGRGTPARPTAGWLAEASRPAAGLGATPGADSVTGAAGADAASEAGVVGAGGVDPELAVAGTSCSLIRASAPRSHPDPQRDRECLSDTVPHSGGMAQPECPQCSE
ncbi:hypothetical protein GCM10009541_26400 [Micromonospora gifhornensis]|uniref:Uncharacterized protein n=1 Tax=Micromonospora gifhornensis TaxID=84594 RepID=A0ABQ4ILE0_9ACTN|nr:hypothetical protein Vgi01_54080 [Micromonospora gifhornensis]